MFAAGTRSFIFSSAPRVLALFTEGAPVNVEIYHILFNNIALFLGHWVARNQLAAFTAISISFSARINIANLFKTALNALGIIMISNLTPTKREPKRFTVITQQ